MTKTKAQAQVSLKKVKSTRGRKSLPFNQRKVTVGVGLKQHEIERLEAEREIEKYSTGNDVDLSNFARRAILSHVALLELVRSGELNKSVIDKINSRRAEREDNI